MGWDGLMERRRHPRANICLRLVLEGKADDAGEATRLETLNLSAGGFYCSVTRSFDPLTRLGLRFVFPPFGPHYQEARSVDCEAVVIRCEPVPQETDSYRLAACFTRLAPEDRRYLTQYVDWHREVYGESQSPTGPSQADEAAA